MSKKNLSVSFVLFAAIFTACNGVEKKVAAGAVKTETYTGFGLDERLKEADSIVFVFYKDPYGTDSVRYTRYYSQFSTTDRLYIQPLLTNLNSDFTKEDNRRKCRGEGKIWCYSKKKVFQTLYFSTRADSCGYLHIMKEGYYYYGKLSQPVVAMLATIKPLAKELENKGLEANE